MFNYNKMGFASIISDYWDCFIQYNLTGLAQIQIFVWNLGKEKIIQEGCFSYFDEVVLFS